MNGRDDDNEYGMTYEEWTAARDEYYAMEWELYLIELASMPDEEE